MFGIALSVTDAEGLGPAVLGTVEGDAIATTAAELIGVDP
jgi:hypothetical protein